MPINDGCPDRLKEATPREIVIAFVLTVAVLFAFRSGYAALERFDPPPEYRIDKNIRGGAQWDRDFAEDGQIIVDDYWVWQRWARVAAERDMIFVLGDSYVWGESCSAENTLPAQLSRATGMDVFANLGSDGMHPLALERLVRHYAPCMIGRTVLLHYNFLWSSTPRFDWKTSVVSYQNPRLAPMFFPSLPALNYDFSQRMTIIKERIVPGASVMTHLVTTSLDNTPLLQWIIRHPKRMPFGDVQLDIPSTPGDAHVAEGSPYSREWRYPAMELTWMQPEKSHQFNAFVGLVEYLRNRGCDVLVMVGPFNRKFADEERFITLRRHYGRMLRRLSKQLEETTLPEETRQRLEAERAFARGQLDAALWTPQNASVKAFERFKKQVVERFKAMELPFVAPELDPESYADPHHPTGEGYGLVVEQMTADPVFDAWLGRYAD